MAVKNAEEMTKPVRDYLEGGGEFVLERDDHPNPVLIACSGPHGTYSIVGKDSKGAPNLNQGAARLTDLLGVMEQQAPLSEWKTVEGG